MEVKAYQHIYANAESEQSPTGRSGFQTLFYTRSALSEEEIEEMESRLLYFWSEADRIKRVFFVTRKDRCVVAQINRLPEADSLGRKGRYIAHSLIFTKENLRQLGVNPFMLFRSFSFITTIEEALEQGDMKSGNIPSLNMELASTTEGKFPVEIESWTKIELRRLSLLALRASQLAKDRISVAFVGEPDEVERALEVAYLAVPTELRYYCTFDTYFYRCNLVATYYWAIGLLEKPGNPNLLVVDTRSRQIMSDFTIIPQDTYERWVIAMIESGDWKSIIAYKDHAYNLCNWLDEKEFNESSLDSIPSEVIRIVFGLSPEQLRLRISERLGKQLPAVLADRLLGAIHRNMDPVKLFRALRTKFDLNDLLKTLDEVYASEGYGQLSKKELHALDEVLQHVDDIKLRFIHACLTGQLETLQKILKGLNEYEYKEFVQIAIRHKLIKPFSLLIPKRGNDFVDVYLHATQIHERDWVSLIEALCNADDIDVLDYLIPYIRGLSPNDIDRISKLISKRSDVPKPFREALDQLQFKDSKTGLKDKLKSLLDRTKRRDQE